MRHPLFDREPVHPGKYGYHMTVEATPEVKAYITDLFNKLMTESNLVEYGLERGVKDVTQPLDMWNRFEPDGSFTLTLKFEKPEESPTHSPGQSGS